MDVKKQVGELRKLASSDAVSLNSLHASVQKCLNVDPHPQRLSKPEHGEGYYAGSDKVAVQGLNLTKRHSERERLTPDANGVVLALVGLPARGKSFISRKLGRFLEWRGNSTKVFNVGKYRREAVDPGQSGRSDFFDSANTSAMAAREAAAASALQDALRFLDGGGKFAILDATNSTLARRKFVLDMVRESERPYNVVFVEAICDDREVLETNVLGKVLNSPDFEGMTVERGLADLKARIAKYEEVYETVMDSEGAYIKVYDLSSKVMANHIYGRLAKSILPFMMAIHIGARPIWLVRAGAGEGNPQSPGSGDRAMKLSSHGQSSAVALAEFVRRREDTYWRNTGKPMEPTHVLTSTMPRAQAFVQEFCAHHEQTSALNPVDKGILGGGWWEVECNGELPPWEELASRHPEFFGEWVQDPLRRRFPGGESYMDVVARLEGVLVEVEMSTRPVLLVSHLLVMQILVAYFKGIPIQDCWKLAIPRSTIYEVSPTSGGGFVVEENALASVQIPMSEGSSDELREPEAPSCCKRPACGAKAAAVEEAPLLEAGGNEVGASQAKQPRTV